MRPIYKLMHYKLPILGGGHLVVGVVTRRWISTKLRFYECVSESRRKS